ncbi:hypothetical protein NC653_006677 [Populus alba x Populus x berolinensis]|uniref:Uncharacterized protein n=1 Tax=Populus alba x Populus x berolinensis TaxID=444605 RepID=A0AAD6WCG8_9ROSI|nr:hypothetical protein NC653_006677 [Populus alba x Populus x berolinensis]
MKSVDIISGAVVRVIVRWICFMVIWTLDVGTQPAAVAVFEEGSPDPCLYEDWVIIWHMNHGNGYVDSMGH